MQWQHQLSWPRMRSVIGRSSLGEAFVWKPHAWEGLCKFMCVNNVQGQFMFVDPFVDNINAISTSKMKIHNTFALTNSENKPHTSSCLCTHKARNHNKNIVCSTRRTHNLRNHSKTFKCSKRLGNASTTTLTSSEVNTCLNVLCNRFKCYFNITTRVETIGSHNPTCYKLFKHDGWTRHSVVQGVYTFLFTNNVTLSWTHI